MTDRDEGWARRILLGGVYVPLAIILCEVAEAFDVEVEDLLAKNRDEPLATARLLTYRLLRRLTDSSYPQIGRIFGRDHSTIIDGVTTIGKRIGADERIAFVATELELRIMRGARDTDQPVSNTH